MIKKINKIAGVFLSVFVSFYASGKDVMTVSALSRDTVLLSATDFHITNENPFPSGAVVDLSSENAWLFLDEVRPSEVRSDYLAFIKVHGQPFEPGVNGRLDYHRHGTVIIPHAPDFVPLVVSKGENFTGDSYGFGTDSLYNRLDSLSTGAGSLNFDNAIRSFKLKRGYMATFANESSGLGFSRVFIAEDDDMEIPVLQKELNGYVSFIRVFTWRNPSKKGWCSAGINWANEIGLTESTWYYSWSADKETQDDQEYAAIRQNRTWPSTSEITEKNNVTHLLGYNEPDRPEQSNLTVETAVAYWPELLKSGMRLGAPAIADDLNWLYAFMDSCDNRNYRVDYVAVHCYWNRTPQNWYQSLKTIHERTGRPLWITEWNNGANWTGGSWPSDTIAQQEKQLSDLTKILEVLDTASFVERYSIYNWVEDKRAIVKGKISQEQINAGSGWSQNDLGATSASGWCCQYLTPAGIYYKNNRPALAYRSRNDVAPSFRLSAPALSVSYTNGVAALSWTDYNGELTGSYVVERKSGDGGFEEVAAGENTGMSNWYAESPVISESGKITYRIKISSSVDDSKTYSNEVNFEAGFIPGTGNVRYGKATFSDTEWKNFVCENAYADIPGVVYGAYNIDAGRTTGIPLVYKTQGVSQTGFRFMFSGWDYYTTSTVTSSAPGIVPFLVAKQGNYDWGGLSIESGSLNNVRGNTWTSVTFQTPFEHTPVVFANVTSAISGYPVFPRVRNVTETGFEVRLTKETAKGSLNPRENVSYVAIETGSGMTGEKKIRVGFTDMVGELSGKQMVDFDGGYEQAVFISAIQTANDDLTYVLRYDDLTENGATVYKVLEKSAGTVATTTDKVGWLVVEDRAATGLSYPAGQDENILYPSVTSGILHLNMETGNEAAIYAVTGDKIRNVRYQGESLDVSGLHAGIYLLKTKDGRTQRFIKIN